MTPLPGLAQGEAPAADPPASLAVTPLREPSEPAAAVAAEDTVALERVVVTAQKREEDVQDVPISVQAFGPKTLDDRQITDQFSLQQAVPGLDVNDVAQFTTIYLRGVGSDVFLNGDPSVASYVDAIYFPFAQGLDQDFGAVERVEVLKGPQGTLFGRNAVGGAISVLTRDPQFDQAETSIQAVFGQRDTRFFRLYQNLPVSRWAALNISAYDNRADNHYTGTANGEPLPLERSRGARLKLRLQPLEELDLMLAGLRVTQTGVGSAYQLNAEPLPAFSQPCALPFDSPFCIEAQRGYEGALSTPSFLDFDNEVLYGRVSFRLPWLELRALGSHQQAESVFIYDFDGSARALAAFDQKRNFARVDTAELQLLSHDGSPLSEWFRWIVGGYYFKSAQGFDPANLQAGGLDLANQQAGGLSLPDPLLDLLRAANLNIPNGDIAFHGILGTLSKAAFAQLTVQPFDWLGLTAGLRYQDEDRYLIRSDSGLFLDDGGFQTLFNWNEIGARDADGNTVPTRDNTTSTKPKFALELRPFGADTLLYASYQRALKSSTYNAVAIYQPPAFVEPEALEAREVGLKTTLFEGQLQFNLAAFRYQIENFQVQFISLLQGGAVSFENAEAAQVEGVDFDARINLWPQRIERLVLTLSGAWLDGRYLRYTDASGFDDQPSALYPEGSGLFRSDNDYSGRRTVRTPEFTGVVGLSKAWDIAAGRLELGGDLYHNDGFFYAASNDPRFDQPRYTVYGLRLSYLHRRSGLRLTAFGRNLGETLYSQGVIATDFGANTTLAPPRTLGLRLNWDF
ncbi:MAG TPA: TonB-dependent receptor [Nevskiaceae bacterium]|nr:TonB-dependent receptor [Nevskiaceae bacterium]